MLSSLPAVTGSAAAGEAVTLSAIIGTTATTVVTVIAALLIIGGTIAYIYLNDPPIIDWLKTTFFGVDWEDEKDDGDHAIPESPTFQYSIGDSVNWNRPPSTLHEMMSGETIDITKCRYNTGSLLIEFTPSSYLIPANSGGALYLTGWIQQGNSPADRKWGGIVHRIGLSSGGRGPQWTIDSGGDAPIEKFGNYNFDGHVFAFKDFKTDGTGTFLAGKQRFWLQVYPGSMDTNAKYGLIGIDPDLLDDSKIGARTQCYVEIIYVPEGIEQQMVKLRQKKGWYLNEDYDMSGFQGLTRNRELVTSQVNLSTPQVIMDYRVNNQP
mgnify:CR=1 FL=1